MKKLLIIIAIIALAYKGYCNFTSYPKRHINVATMEEEERDESEIFFGQWNPCGRQKPVFNYPRWGM